ncbi:L-selenocysteine selenide-lyase (L-alanine-forming) [Plasticicumulans acidivorans]|uniref:cysteine desulfurase n=2 Tax=Plasticicumulans acidivorans TaxID=886464 RepID=A0A317MSY9_9GAMM|nr:L-selenocysteine selenide-lyase (L-alanine-forming) [Plasticicumulans acidivorans]
MSTPMSTSEWPQRRAVGVDSLVPQGGGGLPDEQSLAQMANVLFALLPGQAPVSAQPSTLPPPSLVAVPATPPAAVLRSAQFGPPAAYAAALPTLPPLLDPSGLAAAVPLSADPAFYFLGTSLADTAARASSAGVADPAERIVAQSFGLPGEAQAVDLLREVAAQPNATRHRDERFYFLDATPAVLPAAAPGVLDVQAVRRDFPILAERVNGRPLVWFDNAATTQKPQAVIDRLAYFYTHENSNIHRAAHELAARATDAYEHARDTVARFLGAGSSEEIVFVRGATEAINLVAQSWGRQSIGEGDEIIVSLLEHHANIVPWQQLAAEKGARLRVIPVDDDGQVLLDEYRKLLNERTRLVAVTQVSNALGTVLPVGEIVRLAHAAGALALVDGAQAVSHLRVDVQALNADFYVFSGHKVFAPTGIGVLYAKAALLEAMPPWQGGGNMIQDVTFERTLYQGPPARFEAGTGNIADAVGLGAALEYVERIGLERIAAYEHGLLEYALQRLRTVPGLHLLGNAAERASVAAFTLDGFRPEEVGRALNREGIAVRAGHHCAQPILRRFGVEASVRPSLAFYNTREEIDVLLRALHQLVRGRSRLPA